MKYRIFRKLRNAYNSINFFLNYKNIFDNFDFYINKTNSASELEELYRLRYKVYCEEYKYIDQDKHPNKFETDEYDQYSDHFVMRDKTHEIAAMVRVIKYSREGFPLEKFFQRNVQLSQDDQEKTVEISRLIVAQKYRKKGLLLFLLKGLYRYALDNNVRYAYSVMDETLYPILKKIRVPLRIIGPKNVYQGVTFPCLLSVSEWIDEVKSSRAISKFFSYGGIEENVNDQKYVIH